MEFKEYFMEDALSTIIDYRGKTPKKSESGIPTLSAKSVKNNYINYAECYYISEEEYKLCLSISKYIKRAPKNTHHGQHQVGFSEPCLDGQVPQFCIADAP